MGYEPIPLSVIIRRNVTATTNNNNNSTTAPAVVHHNPTMMSRHHPNSVPTNTATTNPSIPIDSSNTTSTAATASGGADSGNNMNRRTVKNMSESEAKQQEKNVYIFMRILKKCVKKNNAGDPAFSNLIQSMQTRLKQLVGPQYWKKTEGYLTQFLQQQYLKKQQEAAGNSYTFTAVPILSHFHSLQEEARFAADPLPASSTPWTNS